jgi:Xaa-Pro aminopeptidase
MHFGRPTPEQCEAYTRVLQGHVSTRLPLPPSSAVGANDLSFLPFQIAIDSAIFPEGTTGLQLDVLARKALWQEGLNYMVRFSEAIRVCSK